MRTKLIIILALLPIAVQLAYAADSGVSATAGPSQNEKFFDPDRYSFTDANEKNDSVIKPYFSVSHDKREEDVGFGVKQTTDIVHGEAGGRLNLLGDISLTTFAKIPVFAKGTIENQKTAESGSSSELFQKSSKLSWRSELGVPIKKGLDMNFFYDNSSFGRVDKPGVEEREEKFGTKFIFKFK